MKMNMLTQMLSEAGVTVADQTVADPTVLPEQLVFGNAANLEEIDVTTVDSDDLSLARYEEELEQAIRTAEAVSMLQAGISSAVAQGGLDVVSAEAYANAYQAILGAVTDEEVEPILTLENFKQVDGRLNESVYTEERVKKKAKKLGAWVIKAVQDLYERIVAWLASRLTQSGQTRSKVTALEKRMGELKGNPVEKVVKFGGINYMQYGKVAKMMNQNLVNLVAKNMITQSKDKSLSEMVTAFGVACSQDITTDEGLKKALTEVDAIKEQFKQWFLTNVGETTDVTGNRLLVNKLGFGGKRKNGTTIYSEVLRGPNLPGGTACFLGIPAEGGDSFISVNFMEADIAAKMKFATEADALPAGQLRAWTGNALALLDAHDKYIESQSRLDKAYKEVRDGIRNVIAKTSTVDLANKAEINRLRGLVDEFSNLMNSIGKWYKGNLVPASNLAKACANYAVASATNLGDVK